MSRKRDTPEQIISMLRETEVALSQGQTVGLVCRVLSVFERRACRIVGQHRSNQRKSPRCRPDKDALTAEIMRLASQYGRHSYRRITAPLRTEGWHVNSKRVQRIWQRERQKFPKKQPKRGRLRLNDGSCIRLRPSWTVFLPDPSIECPHIANSGSLNSALFEAHSTPVCQDDCHSNH